MGKKFKRLIKRLLGRPMDPPRLSPVEWYRKNGAIIGEDVDLIECSCTWYDATRIKIGDHVTCVYTHFLTHDASLKKFIGNDCNKIGRIEIGDNVFIGLKTIILPNVHIGSNVVIGAGSVVTKDIPDNSVAVGNPARVIGTCQEYIEKHQKKMEIEPNLVYWNLKFYEMSTDKLVEFNNEIDGKIVYSLKCE